MEKEQQVLVENEAEQEKVQTNEQVENKRPGNIRVEKQKGVNKWLIITAIVLGLIAIGMIVFALVNKLNQDVYSNVYLSGYEVSGMTETEVVNEVKLLSEEFSKRVLTIKHNGETLIEITPDSIDMVIDEQETVKSVMQYGRTENIVLNNITILKTLLNKVDIEPIYKYSESKLINIATDAKSGIAGVVQDDTFSLDEENYVLVITKGKTGQDIVIEEFKQDIVSSLKDKTLSEYTLELQSRSPKTLDVDVVAAKICREAKDAYIDETVKPVTYNKHTVGISFKKEELIEVLAKQENQTEGKVIKFKLTTTQPKVKIQDITKNIYRDKLASYTSSYASSDSNRASNVALGAKLLNGTIVMPGETFSFNKTVGDCGLSSRGFKPAATFKGGKVVQEVGGGICQVVSTLYVSTLYANLGIVSRSNHALPVGYVPVSLDATVYYPYLDFKFKNTRDYPIKIVATTSMRKLTIEIRGTKEEKEYDVELSSWKTATIQSKVQNQQDSSLAKGKTKIIQQGTAGYKSVAYKTVKYNGKVISKVLLSEDSYGSTPKIIAVGTKVVNNNQNNSNNNNNNNTSNDNTTGGNTSTETPGETTGGATGENTSGNVSGSQTQEGTTGGNSGGTANSSPETGNTENPTT